VSESVEQWPEQLKEPLEDLTDRFLDSFSDLLRQYSHSPYLRLARADMPKARAGDEAALRSLIRESTVMDASLYQLGRELELRLYGSNTQ
jgi:hypothetical protein